MIHKVKLEGVIVVRSDAAFARVVELAERDELFDFIEELINSKISSTEVLSKLDEILAAVKTIPEIKVTQSHVAATVADPVPAPVEGVAEKIALPVSGSAATVLDRMKKIRKVTSEV